VHRRASSGDAVAIHSEVSSSDSRPPTKNRKAKTEASTASRIGTPVIGDVVAAHQRSAAGALARPSVQASAMAAAAAWRAAAMGTASDVRPAAAAVWPASPKAATSSSSPSSSARAAARGGKPSGSAAGPSANCSSRPATWASMRAE